MAVLVACAVGVAIGLLLVWMNARAAITIAIAEIRNGKLDVTRGRLSPRVLGDLRDVASRLRIQSATLRIVRAKDHARLEVQGDVNERQVQTLRNVVGNATLAQLVRADRR
jgi:Protein of unknown function (DUF3634)